jgi:acetate kinase
MGYTPTSGLVMGTRAGDVDPGVILELIERGMTAQQVNVLLNKQSGLLGVSGLSRDMRDLLAAESSNANAAAAIALFCHRARKYLGAFASVLGGVDTLAFTGGIGEKAPVLRERICTGHEYLGLALDPAANRANAAVISAQDSKVVVRVVRADEEGVIVRHTLGLLEQVEPHAATAAVH